MLMETGTQMLSCIWRLFRQPPCQPGGKYMHGYENMYCFQNLYNAHLAARRGKRYKTDVIQFEMNLAQNLCALQKSLAERTYKMQGYFHFTIHDPKTRLIFAPSYADRVVQHCLCDNIIMPTLEPRLIYDNAACRLGKGTHFSLYRLSGFMRKHYSRFGANGFFLKCDVHKYFETIGHAILKQKLRRVFNDSDTLALMNSIKRFNQKTASTNWTTRACLPGPCTASCKTQCLP